MTHPPTSLLAIRDAQIITCTCGNRLLPPRLACPVCALLRAETQREAS